MDSAGVAAARGDVHEMDDGLLDELQGSISDQENDLHIMRRTNQHLSRRAAQPS